MEKGLVADNTYVFDRDLEKVIKELTIKEVKVQDRILEILRTCSKEQDTLFGKMTSKGLNRENEEIDARDLAAVLERYTQAIASAGNRERDELNIAYNVGISRLA